MIAYFEARILIAVDLSTNFRTIEEAVESFQEEIEKDITDVVLANGVEAVDVRNWEWQL